MMRIFSKNFLKPIGSNIAGITVKRSLYSFLEKGFARNFKPRGNAGGAEESSIKIPKYQTVSNANTEAKTTSDKLGENIVLPNRGARFEGDYRKPRGRFGEEGAEGESKSESFGERPPRFNREGDDKPRRSFGDREGFKPRSDFGDRSFGDRPPRFNRSADGEDRPPRRDFGDRPPRDFGDRPPRREFGGEDRPPRFNRSADGEDRPPRRDFGDRPPRDFGDRPPRDFGDRPPRFNRSAEGDDRPKRDFGDRPPRDFGDRPPRREFGGEDRPKRDFGDRPPRDFGDRPPRDFGDRPPRRDFGGEDRPKRDFGDRPPRREFGGEDRPPRKDFGGEDRPPRRDFNERSDRPRFNRDDKPERTERAPRKFDKKEESVEDKEDETEVNETTSAFNSFAKETNEEEKNGNRITIADLKNRRKTKLDADITKVDDAEEIMNVSETVSQKYKLSESKLSPPKVDDLEEKSEKVDDLNYEFKDSKLDYIYGAHAVEAAVSFNFRKNLDLFVQMSYKENPSDKIKRVMEIAQSKNIKIKYLPREKMDKFTGGRPHNGLVLKSQPRDYIAVRAFSAFAEKYIHKEEGNMLVLLDQIVDPQNFGSIIRSAFFLGSDALLMNKNNKPPISSTVCKVSSGASECAELFAVKNIRRFLGEAIEKGWTVLTTSIEKDSDVQLKLNNNTTQDADEEKDNEKTENKVEAKNISLTELHLAKGSNVILVLGSEANGITSDVNGVSNYNVYIPPLLNKELTGKHPFNIIDSLNVGVSAGIIINHIKSQLKHQNVSANIVEEEIETPANLL